MLPMLGLGGHLPPSRQTDCAKPPSARTLHALGTAGTHRQRSKTQTSAGPHGATVLDDTLAAKGLGSTVAGVRA